MRTRWAVLVSVAAVAMAACSSNSGTSRVASGTATTAAPSRSTGASVTEVKIALAAPLAGSYASYGKPIADGEKLAADEINGAGGVGAGRYKGAKLTIVPFDDQLDPKQDADIAQKVVDDTGIWAFTGLAGSDGALAAKPILNRAGVPLISSYASSPEITKDARRTFIIASPHAAYAGAGIQAAKDAGSQSIAILQITGGFGDSISKLAQADASAKALKVATVQTMGSGDTNVDAQVLAAKNSGADTLVTVGYAGDVTAAVTAVQKLQWKPRLVDAGGGAFDPALLKPGVPSEGLVGVVDYDAASQTPANKVLRDAYQKAFGSADVPPPAAHGYETVKVIAAALAMGPKDRAELGDDIGMVKLPDTGVGALSFDAGGNPVGRPMWVFTVEGGAFHFQKGYAYDGRDMTPLPLSR